MASESETILFCGDVFETGDEKAPINQPPSRVQNEPVKDPRQWHEFLCLAENARRVAVSKKLEQNKLNRVSLQQLFECSVVETQSAFRAAMGIYMAQSQLSSILAYGMSGTSVEDEKNDTDPELSMSVSRKDAGSILENQHSLLEQRLSGTVPYIEHAAFRIKEVADRCEKYSQKLDERAKQILDRLQQTENLVQRAWDTYVNAATLLFRDSKPFHSKKVVSSILSSEMMTVGNLWLMELKYRSVVSQQFDEWEKMGTLIQLTFTMAKDAERQRRIKLRQYLHLAIQRPHTAFSKTERSHADALVDWMGRPDEVVGDLSLNDDGTKFETQQNKKSKQPPLLTQDDTQFAGTSSSGKFEETEQSWSRRPDSDSFVYYQNLSVQKRVQEMARLSGSISFAHLGEEWDYVVDLNNRSKVSNANEANIDNLDDHVYKTVVTNTNLSRQNVLSSDCNADSGMGSLNHEIYDAERLLYSGTLLESDYVQYAAVVVLETEKHEESVTHPKNSISNMSTTIQLDDTASKYDAEKLCLAVITTDETLHLFDLVDQLTVPSTGSTEKVKLGSTPAEAMQATLVKTQASEKASNPVSDKSKRDRVSVESRKAIDNNHFKAGFRLSPCFSLKLSEYTVRMTRRGGFAVKITKNLRTSNNSSDLNSEATTGNKQQLKVRLKVSSSNDQLGIVSAARGQLTRMEV